MTTADASLKLEASHLARAELGSLDSIIKHEEIILITGANGFIGTRVVSALLTQGFWNIRCFVRPTSRLDRLQSLLKLYGADPGNLIVVGDLRSAADCMRATKRVSVIIHLAASFEKSFDAAFRDSVQATRNLLEAFSLSEKPKRFVHVSSFAVYSNWNMRKGAVLDETSPLESSPHERSDAYAFGKLKQEEIVRELCAKSTIQFVVLRPGSVFGPGKRDITGRIGVQAGRMFFHIGGSNVLPLTYVDNCAEAVLLAGVRPGIEGETFNVVDDELLTSRQFLRAYRSRVGHLCTFPIPYGLAFLICAVNEHLGKYVSKLPRSYNRRRCAAEWKGNRFTNQKLRKMLGWSPRVSMQLAMKAFLDQFDSNTE